MPKANHAHSTALPRADTPPKQPAIPRRLRHLDSDAQWGERSPENKLCTASGAAYRLRGFANVLRSLALCLGSPQEIAKHAFLADAVDDVALALEFAARHSEIAERLGNNPSLAGIILRRSPPSSLCCWSVRRATTTRAKRWLTPF